MITFYKLSTLSRYIIPTVFFTIALFLSLKMSLQGLFLPEYFLKSVVAPSISVKSKSNKFSLKGFILSDTTISIDDTDIGTLNTLRITPKLTKLFKGEIETINATSGTIEINTKTLPLLIHQSTLDFPFKRMILNDINMNILGHLYTITSTKDGWTVTNKEMDRITIHQTKSDLIISSPFFNFPYISLANIHGKVNSADGLGITATLSPLKSKIDLNIQKKANIIDLSGTISSNHVSLGNITGAYSTDTRKYVLKAEIKELPFSIFKAIMENHITLPVNFVDSGLIALKCDLSNSVKSNVNSVTLDLTNLKAKLFLYDFIGVSGTIALSETIQNDHLTVSVDSIKRHRLNFENNIILLKNDNSTLVPTIITSEFAKGTIRLHDFKLVDEGLEATAEIEDMDINDAISISSITSLAATGIIRGTARILLTKEKVIILSADLSTTSPKGKIHYFPKLDGLDDQKSSQALENLDYTILKIAISASDINEPASIKIQIVGTNPILSNGYPLDFTIETQASLMDFYS